MITITKNSVNDFVVTLNERGQLTNPYYLMNCKSNNTKESLNFIVPSLSSNSRYNELRLIETGSTANNLNISAGTVNLSTGFHSYKLYESSTMVFTGTGLTLLEQGVLYVF